jgi:phenylacetate-CoA ligase
MRYRTEDLVRVTRQACRCGRTHARQWPVGRLGDLMIVRGVSVTPSEVWRALESVPETAAGVFQIVKTGTHADRLTIRVGYDAAQAPDLGDLRDRVGAAIWAALSIEADLELWTTDALLATSTTGKIQRVVKA